MQIEQQPAYVLHARAYRETSLLLECLTRDFGRVGVVARGVRGPRARIQRADLEPFQPLAIDYSQRGELATLRAAEPLGTSRRLVGDALLSGLYINELVVRMCAREDAQSGLYENYAIALERLCGPDAVSWTLRRFERDFLQVLGYALELNTEILTGEAIEPDALYRYVPEQGPERCGQAVARAVRGADLRALALDRAPDADGLRRLRWMMRGVLAFHLGGVELRAWRMLRPLAARE
jgi:DNA repair protein RecO (recombination protein O)